METIETILKNEQTEFNYDQIYSIEDYLLIESKSFEKNEFRNGKIVKMAGAQPSHNQIAANLIAQLIFALEHKSKEYIVLTSDTKIHVPRFNYFLYPDAVVVCEQIELYEDSKTVITNPLLIIEVLSPATKDFDRHGKFAYYKQIPSFQEYLMVEQRTPFLLASFKTDERTWKDTEAEGLESSIYLQSIDCTIELKKIYKSVKFA